MLNLNSNVHKRLNPKANPTKYAKENYAELDESKVRLSRAASIY
jgi:hypothetical protein